MQKMLLLKFACQVKILHLKDHCDLCEYKATRKSHLGKHVNTQHKEVPSGRVGGLHSKHPRGLLGRGNIVKFPQNPVFSFLFL